MCLQGVAQPFHEKIDLRFYHFCNMCLHLNECGDWSLSCADSNSEIMSYLDTYSNFTFGMAKKSTKKILGIFFPSHLNSDSFELKP